MNLGGWLLLTVLFSGIFLVIQRAERKRRLLTAIIMLIMAGVIWSYGIYRISGDCDMFWQVLCRVPIVTVRFHSIAVTTTFWSVGAALIPTALPGPVERRSPGPPCGIVEMSRLGPIPPTAQT